MEKINKFNSFDRNDFHDRNALRKIKKFDFYNDHTIALIYDDLGIDAFAATSAPVVANNEFYVFLRFTHRETSKDICALVGAYDVFISDEDLSFSYTKNKELTKDWRTVMLATYGNDYKKALIKIIRERKNIIDNLLDQEINNSQ